MYILRRLFPWPVTIASYSPEPQPICAAEQVHKLREEVCPEIAKTSAFGVSLACLIGKSYDFAVYQMAQGVFLGGIDVERRLCVRAESS